MGAARIVASGLGTGFFPVAPGTAASAATAVVGGALLAVSPVAVLAAALVALLAGLWAIPRAGGTQDPGWVTIDEVAGQLLPVAALARPTPAGLVAAFVLFRLFDITKLGPIGWADRRHGAAWVMADDVIAGAFAAIVVLAIRFAMLSLLGPIGL